MLSCHEVESCAFQTGVIMKIRSVKSTLLTFQWKICRYKIDLQIGKIVNFSQQNNKLICCPLLEYYKSKRDDYD